MKSFIVLSLVCALSAANSHVPLFQFQDLLYNVEHDRSELMVETLKTIGAFAISGVPNQEQYQKQLTHLKNNGRECLERSKNSVKVEYAGMTRTTSAVSSTDVNAKHADCLDTSEIETAFKDVGLLVHSLIGSVNENMPYYFDNRDARTLRRTPLTSAPYLDHVHVYEATNEDESPAAPFHRDNGLFLLVTPSDLKPLLVKGKNGQVLTADQGDVIVLFGRALNEWLFQESGSKAFKAPLHGVGSLSPFQSRTIYARMYVAPQMAVPSFQPGTKTFGSIFFESGPSGQSVSDMCTAGNEFIKASQSMCDEGDAFCWMSCLPLDNTCAGEAQMCTNTSGEQCCIENQTAEDGCLDMDVSCAWSC